MQLRSGLVDILTLEGPDRTQIVISRGDGASAIRGRESELAVVGDPSIAGTAVHWKQRRNSRGLATRRSEKESIPVGEDAAILLQHPISVDSAAGRATQHQTRIDAVEVTAGGTMEDRVAARMHAAIAFQDVVAFAAGVAAMAVPTIAVSPCASP